MILVTLEHCCGCEIIKSRHPELKFIEMPRKFTGNESEEVLKMKTILLKIKSSQQPERLSYPILLDDNMQQISLKVIEPNIEIED